MESLSTSRVDKKRQLEASCKSAMQRAGRENFAGLLLGGKVRELYWGLMDSPERWTEIGEWLAQQCLPLMGRMTSRPFETEHGFEALTVRLFEIHEETMLEVDTAARSMAKTRVIPATLSSNAAFVLTQRVRCALDFSGMIFPPTSLAAPFGEVPDDWNDEAVRAWLLIDLWHRRFDHWLKLEALAIFGVFPFYGLTPTDPNEES